MFLFPLTSDAGLGPLEPWSATELATAVELAREHLAPWIPFAHTVTDVETARAFLQRFADRHAADSGHMFGIWRDGRLIGGALFPLFDTANGMCELGAWLVPQAQGQGLVTLAARTLVDWALRDRGLSRVAWRLDPRNDRSRAVARRLGLVFEGIQRSAHVVNGQRQDCEVWSAVAGEWPSTVEPS